jgi:two-component system chemotaxis response regulator CheY
MREDQDGHGGTDGGDVRVVAVDQRAERRQVMRRLLEYSFPPEEIAEADSRAAAIELVGRYCPDAVVLEIQMPLEVGLDTIDALGRMSPRPRIVVCSFLHDAATVRAAIDRGADAYVAKPAGAAELRAALAVTPVERAVRHRPPNERPVSPSVHSGASRRDHPVRGLPEPVEAFARDALEERPANGL